MNPFNTEKKESFIALILLGVLSILFWCISPVGTDMSFHVLRIGELAKELLRTHSFPIYMYRDVYSFYGYPIPVFYCNLFLYPFAVPVCAGLSALSAYKLLTLCILWCVYAASLYCFGHADPFKNNKYLASLIYTLQPYFLNELFVRASVGAAMVFVFIPFVLLGYLLIETADGDDRLKGILFLGCGMAGIVMSHVLSTVMIVIALAVFVLIRIIRTKDCFKIIFSILASAAVCLLLSIWYICPMIEQFMFGSYKGQMVRGLQIGDENFFATLFPVHLLTAVSPMLPFHIRMSAIGGVTVPIIIFTVYLMKTHRLSGLSKTEKILAVVYYGIYIFLLIPLIWEALDSTLAFMQFGWRIFIINTIIGVFFMILVTGRNAEDTTLRKSVILIVITSAVYITVFFFGYHTVRNLLPSFMGKVAGHEIAAFEYSSETEDNIYIPYKLDETKLAERDRQVYADSSALEYDHNIDTEEGAVYADIISNDSDSDINMVFPFIMYKGYRAVNTESGENYSVSSDSEGFVNVTVPAKETGRICVYYEGTRIQHISFIISLVSALLILLTAAMLKFNLLHIPAARRI